jgi:hypothetical protein
MVSPSHVVKMRQRRNETGETVAWRGWSAVEESGASWVAARARGRPAGAQDRAAVAAARAAWREMQPSLDAGRLVFVDETWASTNMARGMGRGPRGERVVAAVPHGQWKTSTFLAGLRTDGIVAPVVLDGAINGMSFRTDVEPFLAPSLRPGDTVVIEPKATRSGTPSAATR